MRRLYMYSSLHFGSLWMSAVSTSPRDLTARRELTVDLGNVSVIRSVNDQRDSPKHSQCVYTRP